MHAIIRCGTYTVGGVRLSVGLRKQGGSIIHVDGEAFEFGSDGSIIADGPPVTASSETEQAIADEVRGEPEKPKTRRFRKS